ncbi:MAG: dTDP-4-amino-4,6-dideoxygalactose transaminase [Bacteroidetes bacterium]|nr:MAG: dTDP-4-amino-4,6-dideoxygalactose transaminase [Bacteroidota bacterium]
MPFCVPTITGKERSFIDGLLDDPSSLTQGAYNSKVEAWFQKMNPKGITKTTKSCTQALELTAQLLGIEKGDEVIMASFTHVSTANAFVLRGATPVFIDINPNTMNIDASLIEHGITEKTKAVVVMHYGGVACEMDAIVEICKKHNIPLVEDNAHGIMATYRGMPLGSFGDISCISFDHQKNITCNQGGSISINNKSLLAKFESIYDLGTDKANFLRGEIENYEWQSTGSNHQMSELSAAFLYAQLEEADMLTKQRLLSWNLYHDLLKELVIRECIALPYIPEYCKHNGHIFYIKTNNAPKRDELIAFLKTHEITALFHYTPLHSSEFGKKAGRISGSDLHTKNESEKLIRLPLYHEITQEQIEFIVDKIKLFYS